MRTRLAPSALQSGLALFCVGALVGCSDREPPSPLAPLAPLRAAPSMGSAGEGPGAPTREASTASWCGDGFVALDERTCFVVPARLEAPLAVVFFLHGALAPDATPVADLALVREAASARGFVAVVPRGEPGLCAWKPEVASHFCWPTRRETVDARAPEIVAGFLDAEARIEQAAGLRFARRYAIGFSNGGYFVAYLGLEGLLSTDGVGVVGAGRSAIDESRSGRRGRPFYVAVGDQEPDVTRGDAEHLASVLSLRQWPIEYVVHPGLGHELQADDLAVAWLTWRSADNGAQAGGGTTRAR